MRRRQQIGVTVSLMIYKVDWSREDIKNALFGEPRFDKQRFDPEYFEHPDLVCAQAQPTSEKRLDARDAS